VRLINAHVAKRKTQTATGLRYQVRWTIDPGAGQAPKERKRSNFERKAQADQFVTNLTEAGLRANGWSLSPKGDPVRTDDGAPLVVTSIESYMLSRWDNDWQRAQQAKVLGRMQTLVIETLAHARDRNALGVAFAAQTRRRGARPDPVTDVEWAGRWLRDVGLRPDVDEGGDAGLLAGRRWIEDRSIRVSALGVDTMSRIRRAFISPEPKTERTYEPKTERTYWTCVVSYIGWLLDTKAVEADPLRGLTQIKRDVAGERPEPSDILIPTEISAIAEEMRPRQNGLWRLWVLLTTYCALRISESLAVNGSMFEFDSQGRLFLNAGQQIDREASNGEDVVLTDAKSQRLRKPRIRRTPVPKHLAGEVVAHFGDRIGSPTDTTPLFVGPRGAVGSADTVRGWWHKAVRSALGENHRRAKANPHAMRHAGVTYWFAAGVDEGRVARWGGWTELKELLDTYRGVLDALEDDDLDSLDSFHARWTSSNGVDPVPEQWAEETNVVDFARFKDQRAANR
jgi:site-specific recombinase XerD